jgi:hypothetical protein
MPRKSIQVLLYMLMSRKNRMSLDEVRYTVTKISRPWSIIIEIYHINDHIVLSTVLKIYQYFCFMSKVQEINRCI